MPRKDPAAVRRARSADQRGRTAERQSLDLVVPHFPAAARSRLGEGGADYGLEGVGRRVMEVTVSGWENIGRKAEQAAAAARAAGVREWYLLKPRRKMPGQERPWWLLADAATVLGLLAELDQLRQQALDVDAAYDRGYQARVNAERKPGDET